MIHNFVQFLTVKTVICCIDFFFPFPISEVKQIIGILFYAGLGALNFGILFDGLCWSIKSQEIHIFDFIFKTA